MSGFGVPGGGGFGQPPTHQRHPAAMGGGVAPGGFGSPPAVAPGGFGSPPAVGGGFGAAAPPSAGFGALPADGAAATPGFGAPGGFGSPPPPSPAAGGGFGAPPSVGFGGAPPAVAPTFGLAAAPPAPGGFGAPPTPALGFGAAPSAGAGFGAAPPAPGGFGAPAMTPVGFGAAAAPPSFGGAPQSQPQPGGAANNPFGTPAAGSAPAAPVAFGASSTLAATPASGGGGFGGSSATAAAPPPFSSPGFGQPGQAPSGGGFGQSPTAAAIGTGFGGSAAPAAPGGFGSAPAVAPGGFGAAAPPAVPPAGGVSNPFGRSTGAAPSSGAPIAFGTSSNVTFGASASTTPAPSSGGGFGASSSTGGGFGSPAAGGGFGSGSGGGAEASMDDASGAGGGGGGGGGFGSSGGGGFGASSPAPGAAGGFGSSGGTGFGSFSSPKPGFGSSTDTMNDANNGGGFGGSSNSAWGGGDGSNGDKRGRDDGTMSPFGRRDGGAASPFSGGQKTGDDKGGSGKSNAGDEAAAKLKAKILEKKRRLQELKKEAKEKAAASAVASAKDQDDDDDEQPSSSSAGSSAPPAPAPKIRSSSPARPPRSGGARGLGGGGGGSPKSDADERVALAARNAKRFATKQPSAPSPASAAPAFIGGKRNGGDDDSDARAATLAERNAQRFATKQPPSSSSAGGASGGGGGGGGGSKSILPPDLRERAAKMAAEVAARRAAAAAGDDSAYMPEDLNTAGGKGRRHLDGGGDGDDGDDEGGGGGGGGALVGECPGMCPDEELIRREMEDDVQLLETVDPGGVHPRTWTLRETAVKRFRRSAADFKLDIPDLVRPPRVLERVCGYLEEWVMERDRQGPDPRYSSVPPPPLDVYQFIWDRTRMVRKDFILQNYVGGPGGRCDAVAVRCHERVARWHAMMEHQLSHLEVFATQQSQQNVQELGQTMKTLNQYYDDAAGRSTAEPALEDGFDQAKLGFLHGCLSDKVMGTDPVDFENKELDNSSEPSNIKARIVGSKSASNGTAEPEMRGLYILLTMNNDGGMEVLKYAGRLCVERPEVYNSEPVQLALRIFQAKKEYNYARFFALLRSPLTPYLYSCIMFKHVDQMRKAAFRIMAKTFGARRKDTGENFYDQYPLEDLVRLLCFEDADEAREACRHYSITVKEVRPSSSSNSGGADAAAPPPSDSDTVDMIFWRHADFKEPVDPAKGNTLHLRPRKMVRTIEAKLGGMSRLGVCRGGASGEGAALSKPVEGRRSLSGSAAGLSPSLLRGRDPQVARQQEEERQRQQQEEAARAAVEEKRRAEIEAKRRRAEEEALRKRHEAERRRLEEAARLKKAEGERQRQQQELLRRQQEELARKKAAEEAAKAAAEKRRREEEERRIALARAKAEAEARRKAEEEERERQRLLALQRAEEERLRKIREAEEEARRQREEEARRVRELKLRREREEQERRRKAEEAEKRRIEEEWERKMGAARKLVVWKMWRNKLRQRRYSIDCTERSLGLIDPTFSDRMGSQLNIAARSGGAGASSGYNSIVPLNRSAAAVDERASPTEVFFRLGTDSSPPVDLCDMMRMVVESPRTTIPGQRSARQRTVILFKLAVVALQLDGGDDRKSKETMNALRTWLDSRLSFGRVKGAQFEELGHEFDVRAVVVNSGEDPQTCLSCDAAIFVVAPSSQSQEAQSQPDICRGSRVLNDTFQHLDPTTPRAVLNFDADPSEAAHDLMSQMFGAGQIVNVEPSPERLDDVDAALRSCCASLLLPHTQTSLISGKGGRDGNNGSAVPQLLAVERASLREVGTHCLRDALWQFQMDGTRRSIADSTASILKVCRAALETLLVELMAIGEAVVRRGVGSKLVLWPPADFADRGYDSEGEAAVPGYFRDGTGLPLSWRESLSESGLEGRFERHFGAFFRTASLRPVVKELTKGAPESVRQQCDLLLWNKRYNLCLETALTWRDGGGDNEQGDARDIIYIPCGTVKGVMERVLAAVTESEAGGEYRAICGDFERDDASSAAHVAPRDRNGADGRDTPQLIIGNAAPPADRGTRAIERRRASPGIKKRIMTEQQQREDDHARVTPSRQQKRRRPNKRPSAKKKKASAEQDVSKAFTSQLEALLHGDMTVDLPVGEAHLAEILGECRDDINIP